MSNQNEVLNCQSCGQAWGRKRKRGVKPKNCPTCVSKLEAAAKVASASEVRVQALHCAAGHDWERPAQKGKPPKYCPEHSVSTTKSTTETETTNNGGPALGAPTFEALVERFPNMDREDYYKLQYIDQLLRNDRRKDDHSFTRETQKHIIARLERKNRQLTVVSTTDEEDEAA